jgi:uncharacterized membrane protein YccC
MLDFTFILSSVAFLAIAAPLLSLAFKHSKQKSLYLSAAAATLLVMFAVKLVRKFAGVFFLVCWSYFKSVM